ncbi:MAG TPA: hypothetical protein PLJ21_05255 [Pseudobdellovibrionaceae bacterium]|nr:hypothetical protein [Pseudobdellovibrionaceae bacterium]
MFKLALNSSLVVVFHLGILLLSPFSYGELETMTFKSLRTQVKSDFETVPSLAVFNLRRYLHNNENRDITPELYLHVLYAKGHPSGLGNRDATLKKIKKVLRYEINKDSLLIPVQLLEKEVGIVNAYDLVVLVISPFDNFLWTNTNGTPVEYPAGTESQGFTVHLAIDYIRKDDIDNFLKAQEPLSTDNNTMIYTIPFGVR